MPKTASEEVEAVAFDIGEWWGEVAARFRAAPSWQEDIARLVDPGTAERTVHWGRNYLYEARVEGPDGPMDVVVKQFRNQGWRNRTRRRMGGSKAMRSWRMARGFQAAGVATAEPLAVIESAQPEGPSFFVTARLPGALEARYVLRAANVGTLAASYPSLDFPAFLDDLGGLLRGMHDAGFFHRDLSIGNVLLVPDGIGSTTVNATSGEASTSGGADTSDAGTSNVDASDIDQGPDLGARPKLFVIDLNRARRRQLTLGERTRDLCRLALFRRAHRQRFLDAYWGPGQAGPVRRALYWTYHYGFRSKIASKKAVRGAFRPLREWLRPRRAHAHIPPPDEAAGARDQIVWDALSDQPHQHAGRMQKLGIRLADLGSHARTASTVLGSAPRIWRRYRALHASLGEQPVPWDGLGVCVRPHPDAPEALLEAIDDLGVENVLLRLHTWQDDHREEEALARALHERGHDLMFALPQNRDMVRDPARWRRAITELGERFAPYGKRFQVGQAINRSKWGIWQYDEYFDLAATAAEILKGHPGVEVLGPAVIDFELHITAAVLNHPLCPVHFDALASLLYVDRRGAPENRQMGFDSIDKVVLCQAIAETARHCAPRSVITEVNWPLWEGPHSPAGRTVSVSEDQQADYLSRFFLLALGTGLVERVYWWQMVARGYGLICPEADGALHRRPSFVALATMARVLRGARFLGPLDSQSDNQSQSEDQSPGTYLYRFEAADGQTILACWTTGSPREVALPGVAEHIILQNGASSDNKACEVIRLMPSIQYVYLGAWSVANA